MNNAWVKIIFLIMKNGKINDSRRRFKTDKYIYLNMMLTRGLELWLVGKYKPEGINCILMW